MNLPKERHADAKFDEPPMLVSFPALKKDSFDLPPTSSNSPYFSPISPERLDIHRWTPGASVNGVEVQSPLPFADDTLNCIRCFHAAAMRRIYLFEFVGSILNHSCSMCGDSLSNGPTVRSLSPNYRFPVAHECDSCNWRMCLKCNIKNTVKREIQVAQQEREAEVDRRYMSQVAVMDKQIQQLTVSAVAVAQQEGVVPASMLETFKDSILDLESRLANEKRSKEQLSSLLSSLQKEYIQYKSDVETHLESNAAEQVLLQSRLVEQSVLLADARARIDELTSIQRMEANEILRNSTPGTMSQREAMLVNQNNHLKEEIDALKVSIHLDFDNWKRVVMKQVKAECVKYKERLRRSLRIDTHEVRLDQKDEDNEKELDFLFDELDWTGGMDELKQSPLKMKHYVESSRSSTPEHANSDSLNS
jgi:hypothetical protein